jgi:hypothetical protein
MATEEPSATDSERRQTTIDGFIDRPADAASRTEIDDDQVLAGTTTTDSTDRQTTDETRPRPAETSVPEAPDEIPDPDSPAVQAAAVAGRMAISPLLVEMGEHDHVAIPEGQHHDSAADIVGSLQKVARRGHSIATVFDDWLDLLLYSLAAGDHEAEYQQTAQPYAFNGSERGDRGIDHLGKATGQLFEGVLQTGADILGDVYHLLGRSSDRLGQFFTPHNVAEYKVQMIQSADTATGEYGRGDTHAEAIESRCSVHDPACGSGRLIVSAARDRPDAWYSGVDLDSRCAKMAAINLVFCNVDGQIIHGDSLKMEAYTAYNTYYTESGGVVTINDPDETPTILD